MSTIQTEIKKAQERGRGRVKQTAEIFTPMDLCLQMVRNLPKETLTDDTSTYLDNSCGDGNFLVAIHTVLTEDFDQDSDDVMSRLYGVDLMPDNVETARKRLPGANLVCADALTFDYDGW